MQPVPVHSRGHAACFHSALLSAARRTGVQITGSSVGARVGLVRGTDSIDLVVHLEVTIPDLPREQADELARLAHAGCPYSRATRGNIEVTVDVTDD